MITPGISLKKALLFSLVFHIILLIATLPRFHRKPMHYWMATPVELISLPVAKKAVEKPVKTVAPVREKKKPKEEKEVKAEKAVVNKNVVAIKPKKKKAEEKPQSKPKEIPRSVPAAAPVAVPAAPIQSTAIVPDVNDFPFLYYLNIIQRNVSANWRFDHEGAVHQKVVVYFKIGKDGKVYDQKVEQSSGIAFLDHSALRAILLSSPFPPLPEKYNGNFLGVRFGFEFKKEG